MNTEYLLLTLRVVALSRRIILKTDNNVVERETTVEKRGILIKENFAICIILVHVPCQIIYSIFNGKEGNVLIKITE